MMNLCRPDLYDNDHDDVHDHDNDAHDNEHVDDNDNVDDFDFAAVLAHDFPSLVDVVVADLAGQEAGGRQGRQNKPEKSAPPRPRGGRLAAALAT